MGFSFSDFLNLIKPVFDLAIALLNYPLFGAPLYSYLVGLFIFSFVVGFIRYGSFAMHGISSAADGALSMGRASASERQRSQRSERVGFKYTGD